MKHNLPLLAVAVLSGCQALHQRAPEPVSRDPLESADMPRVEGRKLLTQDGRTLWLQGFSTPSLEWNPQGDNIRQSFETAIRDWNVNVLRLPLKSTYWFGERSRYYPQHDEGETYRALVDDLIGYATERGCYVVLDLHEFKAPTLRHAEFWTSAASRYANHPGVLFDLLNEPHDIDWKEWRDGGELTGNAHAGVIDENDEAREVHTTIGMQALVDTVRATGARNVVIAAGIDWGYDLSGIAEGFALDDPTGHGILYSTHIYPWKSDWNAKVLETARNYAVFVGEAGCQDKPMPFELALAHDPHEWAPDMLAFIQRHELHWAAWSFHPQAGPSLIADWDYTPTPYWGKYVREALRGRRFESDRVR